MDRYTPDQMAKARETALSIELDNEKGADLICAAALCMDTMRELAGQSMAASAQGGVRQPGQSGSAASAQGRTLSSGESEVPASAQDWASLAFHYLQSVFFPDNFTLEIEEGCLRAVHFYLDTLNLIFERERREIPFYAKRDFDLMHDDEAKDCEILSEYALFARCFHEGYAYAFMRLSRVCTPYDTLGHVAGVHHVAMTMARQLAGTKVKVDPGLMSAAAMTHDMGKFGCRAAEGRRVPYLHYYYTWIFCEKYHLRTIGSIASNHSVWDLELENLSVESLLLIYADFRVKSVYDADHHEHVRFWTLDDSYQVILDKLDNVDEAKRRRYARVYSRLKDFENFMVSLGCHTELDEETGRRLWAEADDEAVGAAEEVKPGEATGAAKKVKPGAAGGRVSDPALMSAAEIEEAFRARAIDTNLAVMYNATRQERFIRLLDDIRSEKDWRHVRAYLTVIGEYSAYLPQDQKRRILLFLYEMMAHRDGDIRRQAAAIAGRMLAGFEIRFTKEIPEGYVTPSIGGCLEDIWKEALDKLLETGPGIEPVQRRHAGYAMKAVLSGLLETTSGEKRERVLDILIGRCTEACSDRMEKDELCRFILMDAAGTIRFDMCTEQQAGQLEHFCKYVLTRDGRENQAAALLFYLYWLRQGWRSGEDLSALLKKVFPDEPEEAYCIRYLYARINEYYGIPSSRGIVVYEAGNLYLENQRSGVPWIYKYINLEILSRRQENNKDAHQLYQYASHLLNMLQFSGQIVNRYQAGYHLVKVMPLLEKAQRHEIVMELLRALEIGEYDVSKYIPPFLGRIYHVLDQGERTYLLDSFESLFTSSNVRTVIVTLEAVSSIMQHFPEAGGMEGAGAEAGEAGEAAGGTGGTEEAGEAVCETGGAASGDTAEFDYSLAQAQELERLEGLLCRGMAHYDDEVSQEAFYVLSRDLFGPETLSIERKGRYFRDLARKSLCMMKDLREGVYGYYRAAGLNYIYRFLSDFVLEKGRGPLDDKKGKIAFFPGTFDPFSLGHKAIVREVARMGFTVYLAVDEFSWSKNVQPYEIRRRILSMSVADMKDVYVFPGDIPVNIANPGDLFTLARQFGGVRPYIVAGSDVIFGASAYRAEPSQWSVHNFPHILFPRGEQQDERENEQQKQRITSLLRAEVIFVQLPAFYETVSSTQIRDRVSASMDISTLVDPVVQNYIFSRGLYSMEPVYKKTARLLPIRVIHEDGNDKTVTAELEKGIFAGLDKEMYVAQELFICRDMQMDGRICGAVSYHELAADNLYNECRDIATSAFLRSRISGKVAVISALEGDVTSEDDRRLTVLNEMLEYCQEQGYTYALCFRGRELGECLRTHGFIPVDEEGRIYLVDMRCPAVLFYDTHASFKEAFSSLPEVREEIRASHLRLLDAMTGLYPGQLILCFASEVFNSRLISLITKENNVPEQALAVRKLGEKICVPFAKILRGALIPNTVTKALDTEKVYEPDLSRFDICEFPGYAPLRQQVRTIGSFGREVILVDDFYHKGYRAQSVMEIMEEENVPVSRLVTGLVTGYGKDLARQKGISVNAAYYISNMRFWFIESDLYPFIGGDGIKTKGTAGRVLLPSVNTILPYMAPAFLQGASMEAFYDMSMVCIDNAQRLYRVLEEAYEQMTGRKLTLERIGEVLAEPRIPETLNMTGQDGNSMVSELLEGEKNRLKRLRHIL